MAELLNGWFLALIYIVGLGSSLWIKQTHWKAASLSAKWGLIGTAVLTLVALVGSIVLSLEVDKLSVLMALLVALLGWVIISYARRYLDGEKKQARFVRAMLFTLACVSVLVVSRNLLVIVLAWTGTSVGMHYLLLFYRERKAAQIVAHKKFIVSRLADLCLLIALVLIYQASGTLNLDSLSVFLADQEALSTEMHWAVFLIALAAIFKSAQLPLHGWVIQVMEAPTPVSALLHAGVVNIGGFVLIRTAELVSMAPATQILLVLVGSLTAILAGLVMMTRISIKVRLAWSTCAQMGFMLMEVGLGLYELALLHLVAHSLYKAHAFLSSGDTVSQTKATDMFAAIQPKGSLRWYVGSFIASGFVVLISLSLWDLVLPSLAIPYAVAVILILGFAPLMWLEEGVSSNMIVRGLIRIALLTQLYLVWHALFAGIAPPATDVSPNLVLFVAVSFGLLYTMQIWVRRYPEGRLASLLYPWAYCGFYLDESFTRFTFKLWPARLGAESADSEK